MHPAVCYSQMHYACNLQLKDEVILIPFHTILLLTLIICIRYITQGRIQELARGGAQTG